MGAQKISQLYYMRRKGISQMIKATSAMYGSLRGHMPEELAKEVLISITKEAIKQAEEKR